MTEISNFNRAPLNRLSLSPCYTHQAAAMRQLFYVGNVSYSVCRVAGYKYVMKHFLHEVRHLESCLSLLNQQVRHLLP